MSRTSIILPCYKVQEYLTVCLDSILNQSDPDFELLVIVDGSPDNSLQIAREYAHYDKRIKVFEKKNGGLSDTRNYGLARATGKYIYFMDSDDWIEPHLLRDNLKVLEKQDLDFIIFGYSHDWKDEEGNLCGSREVIPQEIKWVRRGKTFVDEAHLGLLGYAWNKIYRRAYLEKNQLRFEKGLALVEDILFNLNVFKYTSTIRFRGNVYYHYVNREETTLINSFYPNSFELNKRKLMAIKAFCEEWQIVNQEELMGLAAFGSVRYCLFNLFFCNNTWSFSRKVNYLRKIYNDELIRKFVPLFPARTFNNRLRKFLIQKKWYFSTSLLGRII